MPRLCGGGGDSNKWAQRRWDSFSLDANAIRAMAYGVQAEADDVARERRQLRMHPQVMAALSRWWDAACFNYYTFPSTWKVSDDQDLCVVGLSWRQYLDLRLRLYKTLTEPPFDAALAESYAIEDWLVDVNGEVHDRYDESRLMGRYHFLEGIFSVADHWVPGFLPEDYTAFIDDLLESITHALFEGEQPSLKPLNAILYQPFLAQNLRRMSPSVSAWKRRTSASTTPIATSTALVSKGLTTSPPDGIPVDELSPTDCSAAALHLDEFLAPPPKPVRAKKLKPIASAVMATQQSAMPALKGKGAGSAQGTLKRSIGVTSALAALATPKHVEDSAVIIQAAETPPPPDLCLPSIARQARVDRRIWQSVGGSWESDHAAYALQVRRACAKPNVQAGDPLRILLPKARGNGSATPAMATSSTTGDATGPRLSGWAHPAQVATPSSQFHGMAFLTRLHRRTSSPRQGAIPFCLDDDCTPFCDDDAADAG